MSTSSLPTNSNGNGANKSADNTENDPTLISEQERKPNVGPKVIPADPEAVKNAKPAPKQAPQ